MFLFRTDNPIADFNRYDAECEAWLKSRPECSHCGHHIQEDLAYHVNDEGWHKSCFDNNFLKSVEDYIE